MPVNFTKGDKVIVKSYSNRIGIIDGEPKKQNEKLFYPVSFDPSQQSSYYPGDTLEIYLPPKTVEELLKNKEFSSIENFIQTLIYKKLEKPLSDNLYAFYASRTEFQVHQFKPVLKFLNSVKRRLLLADEVGLGKTIETGIIITEMSARLGSLPSILIVCPSMLIPKWEKEMQKRFSLEFIPLKSDDFIKFLERYKKYGHAEKLRGVISLQTLRSSKMIQIIREVEPRFDIVVVDEAHHMRNPETSSSEIGEILSELSDAMLFLSATPLQLGTPDLFNLLSLLIPEEFSNFDLFHNLIEPNEYLNDALRRLHDPAAALEVLNQVLQTSQKERFLKNSFFSEAVEVLSGTNKLTHEQAISLQRLLVELNCLSYVFTRTKKRDIHIQFPIREAKVIRVQFTEQEKEFYDAVTKFVAEQFTNKTESTQGISFAIINPQRQVASCIQAMKESLDDIIKKRTIVAPSGDNGDVIDPFADTDSSWELKDRELSAFKRLKECASKIGDVDSKFDKFLEALRSLEKENQHSKIIVFAFFKKTLDYLKRKLGVTEYQGKASVIHGDISTKDRQKIIKKFRETNDIKILLSSEVGSEGLDFEFCNVIFNYDLPWNPMRVEQRIGRLDRYGQRNEKILIYNFSMIGTIDDEILQRLYRRIKIFEQYIGDLDAILGDQITTLTRDIFNTNLTTEQKNQKIEKIAENILRKQKELEEFEKESQKFIGQDEYFNQEITRIKETKRFITSDEVLFMLENFLKNHFPKTTLLPPKSKRSNVFVLKSDENFQKFIRQYSNSSENINELEKRLSYSGGILVTFNHEEACRDESLEFITIHHPILKAIKRFYDNDNQRIYATMRFRLKGKPENASEYFFFIYLLEKKSLKKDILFVPVLFNMKTRKVYINDEFCDWFLGEIINAEPIEEPNCATYDENLLQHALKEAGDYLEISREDEEQKLRRVNDTLVNNQIESVKQATIISITKASNIISKLKQQGKTEDDPIVKLHNGRVRNFRVEMEKKTKELEQKRQVSVGFNLIAGGIVVIKGGI